MNRTKLKKKVICFLRDNKLQDAIEELENIDRKSLLNPLFSCLCNTSEVVRWHAVSVFGIIVKDIAEEDIENGRVIMRRFLWMLNDESGGIGWGVPEAMAEVMYHQTQLGEEYMHMLVSYTLGDGPELHQDGNFLELPLLQQGVLWGLIRVAKKYKDLMLELCLGDNLSPYFYSEDKVVKGMVCLLANLLELDQYKRYAKKLRYCQKSFSLYIDGTFQNYSIGEIATNFVDK